jgi:site-specific DNA-methyltransferase (adenine-specific)
MHTLPDQSVHTCVTSPPYFGLRDYGMAGQIGLEDTPDAFVARLVDVFREVRRVLRDDGTLWLNLGDSYSSSPPGNKTKGVSAKSGLNGVNGESGRYRESLASGHATKRDTSRIPGIKPKDLIGIPWRAAFALQADGWYLRQDIIWSKPNPMPESVTDRCTKAHEYVFMLSKSARYFFDAEAMREPAVYPAGTKGAKGSAERQAEKGVNARPPEYKVYDGFRNRRSVWTVATKPFAGAHFATFPPDLIEPCILAGCPVGGTVLDPFGGSGTTAGVAVRNGRNAVLCELNPDYAALMADRVRALGGDQPDLFVRAAE